MAEMFLNRLKFMQWLEANDEDELIQKLQAFKLPVQIVQIYPRAGKIKCLFLTQRSVKIGRVENKGEL